MIRLIDVSHFQGGISPAKWRQLKTAFGLSAAICKATEGMSYVDPQLASNWVGMRYADLVRGAYCYSRPDESSGLAQARRLAAVVKPGPGDFLVLDLENGGKLDQAGLQAWQHDFGDALIGLCSGARILYAGGYAHNYSGAGLPDHWDGWMFPHYARSTPVTLWPASFAPNVGVNRTGQADPDIWQWAESLSSPIGLVDASVSTMTAAELAAPTAPVPPPAPIAEEEPMFIVSLKSSAEQFVSNGQTRRWIPDVPYRSFLIARGCDPNVYEFDSLAGMNAAAGDLVPGPVDVASLAAQIAAALPESTGGASKADVVDAVKSVLGPVFAAAGTAVA